MSRLKNPKTLLILIIVLAVVVASRVFFAVPLPHVQVPAEVIPGLPVIPLPLIGDLAITNTMIAVLLADVTLLVLAFLATRRLSLVPGGLQNLVEAVIEFWHNQAVQLVGTELARRWLPLVLTVFLLILASNWYELVPGYDTVGVLYQPEAVAADASHAASGEAADASHATSGEAADASHTTSEAGAPHVEHTYWNIRWLGEPGASPGIATTRVNVEETAPEGTVESAAGWTFVPYLRAAATDLNFTLALALICFVAIEIVGFKAGGVAYLRKFFHFDFSGGLFMGFLNLFVGLLELVSEFVRIISYSFRLFGNMFAGQMLLFVIPFLVPLLAVPVYGLELFVGMIQAFVFAILTLAFMSVAVVSHHGEEHK